MFLHMLFLHLSLKVPFEPRDTSSTFIACRINGADASTHELFHLIET